MPSYVAPGVYVEERDFSDYIAALATTATGMVGAASKGPLDQPTLITSPEQFIEVFGAPNPDSFGPYAALGYLRRGNQLWYVRVAKQYTKEALIVSLESPSGDGKVYSLTLAASHGVSVGDFVQITETGKSTTQGLEVTDVVANVITLNGPLLDTYSPSASSDSILRYSENLAAVGPAETFLVSRRGGNVTRLVQVLAKNPGQWANFGSSLGVEVRIEDGGNFANVDPATGNPISNAQGIALQGVQPSNPSVDSMAELVALTSTDVRVGNTVGVNSIAPIFGIYSILAGDTGQTSARISGVEAATNFEIGDSVGIFGTGSYDGTKTLVAVTTGANYTDISWTDTPPGAPVTVNGYAEQLESDVRQSVVFLCTATTTSGSTWSARGVLTKRLKVFYEGRQVEIFDNLIGYDSTSPNFWEAIESDYINVKYLGAGEQPINSYHQSFYPNNPRYLLGTSGSVRVSNSPSAAMVSIPVARGQDGDSPEEGDYIGIIENGKHSGLQHFRRTESIDISVLAVPGVSLPAVIEEMISVLEQRHDSLGIIDPPYGLNVQQVVDWHNGQGDYAGLHDAFTTNSAALYYPWVRQYDPYSRVQVWMPPSAFIPGVIAYSDRQSDVWFAPAGIKRGTVPNALAVERVLTEGDVEYMYGPGNGNAVNPIRHFAKDGIVVYGNRTLQRYASALDRVNVRRLVHYITKVLSTSCRVLNFDQNDPVLWSQAKNLIEPFLSSLKGNRALEWYKVVCDETTNTPNRRNNNELMIKIYLIPVKAVEKVILGVTLFPSGANVEELIALDLQNE